MLASIHRCTSRRRVTAIADVASKPTKVDTVEIEDGTVIEIEYESKVGGEDGLPPGYIITPSQGRIWFDEAVRKQMGMSGEEFLRRVDAGEWDDVWDKPGYLHIGFLASLRSFAEQE